MFAWMQYLLPQHTLSRVVHWLMRLQLPAVKNRLIHWFVGHFKVDLSDATLTRAEDFESFNAFFTRALDPDARPVAFGEQNVVSPVDGRISEIGSIDGESLYQAKGHHYSLRGLLAGSERLADAYQGGHFATLYLAPSNYHRIHMPVSGTLREMIYVPGRLFSVNEATVNNVPGLFARNERVICHFETLHGPMAMILVGAIFVGSIETVWAGEITPGRERKLQGSDYRGSRGVRLVQGEEMGRFNMGSTVILLFPDSALRWEEARGAGAPLEMGQLLGRFPPGQAGQARPAS